MISIFQIIKRNSDTYYDYRDNARTSTFSRYVIIAISSFLIGILFHNRNENLYIGIITAQSILVGFSFNIIFILSNNGLIKSSADYSIEKSNKIDKLNIISKEIFYNISYYNLIAILSVISCIIMLYFSEFSGTILYLVNKDLLRTFNSNKPDIRFLSDCVNIFAESILNFLLIDCALTFVRCVKRVNYLFEEKIDLDKR